jgi:hypothetical protein
VQVPDDEDWAFEAEIDLWDDGERPTPPPDDEPDRTDLAGQDPDSVVTVVVSPEGAVERVRLAQDWKSRVDPRGLNTNVLSAANAATAQALLAQTRLRREDPPATALPDSTRTDETPLAAQDVLRLADAVAAELDEISTRLMAADRPVSAKSSGGHVEGTAQGGRYLGLELDPTWATIARNTEVEGELTEVLRALHRASVPTEQPGRRQGEATTELLSMVHDPDRLIRRVSASLSARPARREERTTDE